MNILMTSSQYLLVIRICHTLQPLRNSLIINYILTGLHTINCLGLIWSFNSLIPSLIRDGSDYYSTKLDHLQFSYIDIIDNSIITIYQHRWCT